MRQASSTETLLSGMLELAVGLRTLELRQMPEHRRPAFDDVIPCIECHDCGTDEKPCATCGGPSCRKGRPPLLRAEAYAAYIAAHGDNIIYRSKKKGDTAKAFNVLVEALSLMSFVPGGVTFLGASFEVAAFAKRLRAVADRYSRRLRTVDDGG